MTKHAINHRQVLNNYEFGSESIPEHDAMNQRKFNKQNSHLQEL